MVVAGGVVSSVVSVGLGGALMGEPGAMPAADAGGMSPEAALGLTIPSLSCKSTGGAVVAGVSMPLPALSCACSSVTACVASWLFWLTVFA